MARHDKHYRSFFGYFIDAINTYRAIRQARREGKDDDEYLPLESFYLDTRYMPPLDGASRAQISGGLQPLRDTGKDFTNLNKRYKRFSDIGRDLAQPIIGIFNILKGIITLVATPVVFLVRSIIDLKNYVSAALGRSQQHPLDRKDLVYPKENLAETASWLLEGISNITRGVTQLATTPLAWLKVIVMGSVTAAKGFQKIEEDPGFQRELDLAERLEGHERKRAYKHLHRKFERGLEDGRATDITFVDGNPKPSIEENLAAEKEAWKELVSNNASSVKKPGEYIAFFKPASNQGTKESGKSDAAVADKETPTPK